MSDRVGYEIDQVIRGMISPDEYYVYRIRNGRRVDKFGPFDTEKRARDEVDAQRLIDKLQHKETP